MLPRGPLSLVAVPAAACVLLTACSNTSSPVNRRPNSGVATASTVNGVQRVDIDATQIDRFTPSTIYVHYPGKVEIVMHNTSAIPHNWDLTAFPGDFVPDTEGGGTGTVTFNAPAPGRYQFECTIHAKLGQVGTLVVLKS